MIRVARASVVTLFIIGCATGAVVREVFQVPTASAQTGDRFEHFCFSEDLVNEAGKKLNTAGAQGFELVSNTNGFFCMKRRLH